MAPMGGISLSQHNCVEHCAALCGQIETNLSVSLLSQYGEALVRFAEDGHHRGRRAARIVPGYFQRISQTKRVDLMKVDVGHDYGPPHVPTHDITAPASVLCRGYRLEQLDKRMVGNVLGM